MVGKTLNSTGLVMCMETNNTITETVMLALINTSRRKAGMGMIIAMTIPKTARGTPNSERFPNRTDEVGLSAGGECGLAATFARPPLGLLAVPAGFPAMGAISEVAAIAGCNSALSGPATGRQGEVYSVGAIARG